MYCNPFFETLLHGGAPKCCEERVAMHLPPYTSRVDPFNGGDGVEQGPWLAEKESTRSEYEPCEGQLNTSRNQEHRMCVQNAPKVLENFPQST